MQLFHERELSYPDSTDNRFPKLLMRKVHPDKTTEKDERITG